jgi:hypothetical protein
MSEPAPTLRTDDSARAAFLAWEKLRLAYNAALAVLVLALAPDGAFSDPAFQSYLLTGAFAANVCFCAGAWAEGWLAIIGLDRLAARAVVFGLGLAFSCLLTAGLMMMGGWRHLGLD